MPKTAVSLVSSPFVPMVHAANGGQPLDQTDSQRGASWGYLKSLYKRELRSYLQVSNHILGTYVYNVLYDNAVFFLYSEAMFLVTRLIGTL